MQSRGRLTARSLALTTLFTALYTVLSFIPHFQVVGLSSKAITAAGIAAPIIGIVIGAYLGALSALLGGIIALFFNPLFSLMGFAAGVVTALCAGLLYSRRRFACAFIYFSLLFMFGFYPLIGPVWLYPPLLWFQLVGFIILVSPIQSEALKNLNSNSNGKAFLSFFITFLTATLAGQIAGSLIFELISWPLTANLDVLKGVWQATTFLYPIERTFIAFGAALLGLPVHRILVSTGLSKAQEP